MIYEYPEEFVVPVSYANDFSNNPIYRDLEFEYLKIDGLLGPEIELQEDKEFMMNDYKNNIYGNKEKEVFEFDINLVQTPYKENIISSGMGDYNVKNDHINEILRDIDNEYAESETQKR